MTTTSSITNKPLELVNCTPSTVVFYRETALVDAFSDKCSGVREAPIIILASVGTIELSDERYSRETPINCILPCWRIHTPKLVFPEDLDLENPNTLFIVSKEVMRAAMLSRHRLLDRLVELERVITHRGTGKVMGALGVAGAFT